MAKKKSTTKKKPAKAYKSKNTAKAVSSLRAGARGAAKKRKY